MTRIKKHNYYTGGLISLLLLPIAFLFELNQHHVFDKRYSMEVGLHMYDRALYYDGYSEHFPFERKNINFELNGNIGTDKCTLACIQKSIQHFYSKEDTLHGICVHFSNTSKYGSFINMLEWLNIKDNQEYVFADDTFWIFQLPKRLNRKAHPNFYVYLKEKEKINFETLPDYNETPVEYNIWKTILEELISDIQLIKQFWYLFVLYLVLCILEFNNIIQFIKKPNTWKTTIT